MRRLLAALVVLLVLGAGVVMAWPQLFGLQQTFPFTQLASFRGALIAGCAVAVALLLVLMLVVRPLRRVAGSLILAVLVVAGIDGAVLATRGTVAALDEGVTDDGLVVLAWNTLGDSPDPTDLADLAIDVGADIVALPETTEDFATQVAALMAEAGRPMQVTARSDSEFLKARSTSLLLGEAVTTAGSWTDGAWSADERVTGDTSLPSVVIADGPGARIAAVHPRAPLPDDMGSWRADLAWMAGLCDQPDVILAGDFNATLDHMSGLGTDGGVLGGCRDAALETAGAGVGTWPTSQHPLLGTPIDHVMVGSAWTVVDFAVITDLDDAGSDHRPVVAVLRRAD